MDPRFIACATISVILTFTGPAGAQAPGQAGAPPMSACTLLTTADYRKATGAQAIYSEPDFTKWAGGDSVCQFDVVQLVLFWGDDARGTSLQRHEAMLKGFQQDQQPREAVSGIGDSAYFMVPKARGEYDRVALLAARVGPHTLSLTLDIPTGKTAADVKPQLLALARMIVAKVR